MAAKALNRDPLEAIGVDDDLSDPLIVELVLEMTYPKLREERELDEQVAESLERMTNKSAWAAALPKGRGYKGERVTKAAPPAKRRLRNG